MSSPLSPTELASFLAEVLAGATMQGEAYWSNLIGDVERVHLSTNPKANWKVTPTGKAADVETIHAAVEIVQREQPYVQWGSG